MRFRLAWVFLAAGFPLLGTLSPAQVLGVPDSPQQQSQWCWAAVSSCVLNYYGFPVSQCQAAEFARLNATWHSFGPVDCCLDPGVGCNFWNYNYGAAGSVEDILENWGIVNSGLSRRLSTSEVENQIAAGRPFIIRWGWDGGGGHFLVGHGWQSNLLYYMDPWPGEGLTHATYKWVSRGADHTWTHTNVMDVGPDLGSELTIQKPGTGSGSVTSKDNKIDCGSLCRASCKPGDKISLKAAASTGSSFQGWTGCKVRGSACSLVFFQSTTITAVFRKEDGHIKVNSRLAFGTLKTGTSKVKQIKVRNTGKGFLDLGQAELQGSGFSRESDGCSGRQLDPGASCLIRLGFSPPASGSFDGTITLFSDDPAQPQVTIRLTGVGR